LLIIKTYLNANRELLFGSRCAGRSNIMKKKNTKSDNLLPEVSIIAEIDGDIISIEEIDKITFKVIEDSITDNNKPREFLIFCEAKNKNDATSLQSALDQALGFEVYKPSKEGGIWIVDGIKLITYKQLASTLKNVRNTVDLFSCELVDWRIECDNNSV